MKKVILEGAFYSPNASEGKWAWNIAILLDKMAAKGQVELDLFIPPGAENHYYYKQKECWDVFPNSKFVKESDKTYDVHFLLQPGAEQNKISLNDAIKANKKVIALFEIYWYGSTMDRYVNIPDNAELAYALQPFGIGPVNQNWPTRKNKLYQLPYAPFLKPDVYNFENKGIMLTIKNPCDKDFCEATIEARLDCLRLALKYAKEGLRVSVSCADKMFTEQNNPKFVPKLQDLMDQLHAEPSVQFYGNLPPFEMHELIREHSIIFTGKVGESGIYASFVDALNEGSYPLTWTDWPEQFFKDQSIFEPYSYERFQERTARLLSDKNYYKAELDKQRSNMILHTEEDGTKLLERILEL